MVSIVKGRFNSGLLVGGQSTGLRMAFLEPSKEVEDSIIEAKESELFFSF